MLLQVHFSDDNVSVLHFDLSGPADTPFEGGSFRIKLQLPSDYPNSAPKGWFQTKIFHPNVNFKTGEICVSTLKKDWSKTLGLKHVLVVIRCLLIEPNPESALNEEAGKLLLENYADYFARAKMMTKVHAKAAAIGSSSVDVASVDVLTPSATINTHTHSNNNSPTPIDALSKEPNTAIAIATATPATLLPAVTGEEENSNIANVSSGSVGLSQPTAAAKKPLTASAALNAPNASGTAAVAKASVSAAAAAAEAKAKALKKKSLKRL